MWHIKKNTVSTAGSIQISGSYFKIHIIVIAGFEANLDVGCDECNPMRRLFYLKSTKLLVLCNQTPLAKN